MPRYEKWLGAGLGWMVTGNPLGGLLGYMAGSLFGDKTDNQASKLSGSITEFEVNVIVLATHLIKSDNRFSEEKVIFAHDFLNRHFDEKESVKREQIIAHCMNKDYDLGIACDQLRMFTNHSTRIQIIRFLLELAQCDGDLSDRENYFIFRVAGYININDVDFKKLKAEHINSKPATFYEILEASPNTDFETIRGNYRRLVLKYHPDRNKTASEAEKKILTEKFQQLQEAYQQAKRLNKKV